MNSFVVFTSEQWRFIQEALGPAADDVLDLMPESAHNDRIADARNNAIHLLREASANAQNLGGGSSYDEAMDRVAVLGSIVEALELLPWRKWD